MAPLSMGFSRQEYWSGLSRPPLGIFPTRDRTCVSHVSCIGRWVLKHWTTGEVSISHLLDHGRSDRCEVMSHRGFNLPFSNDEQC